MKQNVGIKKTGQKSILQSLKDNFTKKTTKVSEGNSFPAPPQSPPKSPELTFESDNESELNLSPVTPSHSTQNLERALFVDSPVVDKKRPFQSVAPSSIQSHQDFDDNKFDSLSNPSKVLECINPVKKFVRAENMNELSENLRFNVNNKIYSDVVFRVGPNMQLVHAHRIILSTRSVYFNTLFGKKHSHMFDMSQDMIKLDKPDVVPEVFLKVLEYLYTGIVRLKQDDVLDILALSEEFGIPTLKEMCSKFIQENVDVDNSCMLLELSREYNCQTLTEFCLKFIDQNVIRILSTNGFTELSEATLIIVIQRNELQLKDEEEVDIFHAVLRWAKNRFVGFGDHHLPEIINKELREISKNVIQHIRFPLMTSEQLSSIIEPTHFVPQELLFESYKYHLVCEKMQGERFTSRDGSLKKKKKTHITTRNSGKKVSFGGKTSSFINLPQEDSPTKKIKSDNETQTPTKHTTFQFQDFSSPNSVLMNI
jgi:hypothetical protein